MEFRQIYNLGIFLFAVVFICFGCQRKPYELDYCKMLKDDQSFVNQDKSDMAKFESDRAKRAELLAMNFDLLLAKTYLDGFPTIHKIITTTDTCKRQAVQITMIHAAQSNPKLFFSEGVVSIFQKELKKGNLDVDVLRKAVIISARTKEFCSALKPKINAALDAWELSQSLFQEARFVECG